MAKKRSLKSKELPKSKVQAPPVKEDEKIFDFGGMPERDLKKNLGCG